MSLMCATSISRAIGRDWLFVKNNLEINGDMNSALNRPPVHKNYIYR